jgi:hypothetical protein
VASAASGPGLHGAATSASGVRTYRRSTRADARARTGAQTSVCRQTQLLNLAAVCDSRGGAQQDEQDGSGDPPRRRCLGDACCSSLGGGLALLRGHHHPSSSTIIAGR